MSTAADHFHAAPGLPARQGRTPVTVYCVYLAFFTSGFLLSPDLPYVGTKLATPDIFLVAMIIGTMIVGTRGNSVWAHRDRVFLGATFGLFFVYHATLSMLVNGIFFTSDLLISFLTVVNYIYGFLMFACVVQWLNSWDRIATAVVWWTAGATVVGLIGTWGVIGNAPLWVYDGPRVSSTLRAVNQMQSYLIPVLFASLVFIVTPAVPTFRRVLLMACVVPMTLSLLATGSRSTMVMIVLCIGILTYQVMRQEKKTVTAFVLSYALAAAFVLVTIPSVWIAFTVGAEVLPEGPWRRPIRLFQTMLQASDTLEALGPRGDQFRIVFDNWYYRPLLGIGPANFTEVFNHRYEVHNTYLGVLVEHGVIGLALLLGFIGTVILGCMGTLRLRPGDIQRTYLIAVAGAAVFVLIYGAFSFGLRQRVFWMTLGLCAAAARVMWLEWQARQQDPARSRDHVAPAAPPAADPPWPAR